MGARLLAKSRQEKTWQVQAIDNMDIQMMLFLFG
jgi:hypothetical protein